MHPFTLEAPGKAPSLDLAKSSLSIFHLFQHFGSFGVVPSVCFQAFVYALPIDVFQALERREEKQTETRVFSK